jgi:hypothetical protein
MDHPQLTDGHRPVTGSSRRLGAAGSEKKEGERLITPAGHEYANTAFRPAGHRRRHAHRAGGGSGGGWGVATLTATPQFLYGLHQFGPPHATTSPANGQAKTGPPVDTAGKLLLRADRHYSTSRNQAESAHWTKIHFGRLGQIRPPEQASRPLIPFRFTN